MGVESEHDVEVTEALDFDPEVACVALMEPCGRRAVWYRVCRGCRRIRPYCAECRVDLTLQSALLAVLGRPLVCVCGAGSFDLSRLVFWVPIPGGAS